MALTLASNSSPFPYAAIAAASLTGKADIAYDETVASPTLTLNGATITAGDDIVHALVKAGNLPNDSAKVTRWKLAQNLHSTNT